MGEVTDFESSVLDTDGITMWKMNSSSAHKVSAIFHLVLYDMYLFTLKLTDHSTYNTKPSYFRSSFQNLTGKSSSLSTIFVISGCE